MKYEYKQVERCPYHASIISYLHHSSVHMKIGNGGRRRRWEVRVPHLLSKISRSATQWKSFLFTSRKMSWTGFTTPIEFLKEFFFTRARKVFSKGCHFLTRFFFPSFLFSKKIKLLRKFEKDASRIKTYKKNTLQVENGQVFKHLLIDGSKIVTISWGFNE